MKIARFLNKVKRTIQFIPIIWKGADWDYRYAVDLFTYQLSRTADYIEKRNNHIGALSSVKRIRTSVDLLEKVYDEEYGTEYIDVIKEKYGPSNFEFIETGEKDEQGEPYYEMFESYEKDYTDSELLIIAEDKRSEFINSGIKQRRAHKVAWDLIEHNIQRWWD